MITIKIKGLGLFQCLVLNKLNLKNDIQIGDTGWAGFGDDWAWETLKVISTEVVVEITRVNEVTRGDLSTAEPGRFGGLLFIFVGWKPSSHLLWETFLTTISLPPLPQLT